MRAASAPGTHSRTAAPAVPRVLRSLAVVRVALAFVASGSAVPVADPQVVTEIRETVSTAQVAAGDGVYAVAWTAILAPQHRPQLRIVTADGAPIGDMPILLGDTDIGGPAGVAWDGEAFVVAWPDGAGAIAARRVAADGALLDGAPVEVAGPVAASTFAPEFRLACAEGACLYGWIPVYSGSPGELWVQADGGEATLIAEGAAGLDLATSGDGYVATYVAGGVQATFLAADGAPGTTVSIDDSAWSASTSASPFGDGDAVAWGGVEVATFDATGVLAAASAPEPGYAPALAAAGDSLLLAWAVPLVEGKGAPLRLGAASASGSLTFGERVDIDLPLAWTMWGADAASDGASALVAWTPLAFGCLECGSDAGTVHVAALDSGAAAWSPLTPVSTWWAFGEAAAVVCPDDACWVAWTERRFRWEPKTRTHHTFVRRVAIDGTPGEPLLELPLAAATDDPPVRLACSGTTCAALAMEETEGGAAGWFEARVVLFADEGLLSGPIPVGLTPALVTEQLAATADGFVVTVWGEDGYSTRAIGLDGAAGPVAPPCTACVGAWPALASLDGTAYLLTGPPLSVTPLDAGGAQAGDAAVVVDDGAPYVAAAGAGAILAAVHNMGAGGQTKLVACAPGGALLWQTDFANRAWESITARIAFDGTDAFVVVAGWDGRRLRAADGADLEGPAAIPGGLLAYTPAAVGATPAGGLLAGYAYDDALATWRARVVPFEWGVAPGFDGGAGPADAGSDARIPDAPSAGDGAAANGGSGSGCGCALGGRARRQDTGHFGARQPP